MSYKNLIRELAITDFKLKYQGSVLGYLWSFAKPLVLFGVLYFVFTKFIRIGSDIENYPLYLLLGIVLWSYFTDSTTTAMASIVDRADLIRKVYFPRIVIVIAASISSLITLSLNLAIIFIFMLIVRIPIHINALWFLFLLAEIYILSLGCSLLLATLYVKLRDFKHIWEVGLQVMFYASPIIYPLNIVPERVRWLVCLSPIAQILQDARYSLITKQTLTVGHVLSFPLLLVPYLLPIILVLCSYRYFIKASAKFAEEV